MTLPEVEELIQYWIDHPPLHLLIATYLGVNKWRDRTIASPDTGGPAARGTPEDLIAQLGPSFIRRDVHAGLNPVVLDFAELRGLSPDQPSDHIISSTAT